MAGRFHHFAGLAGVTLVIAMAALTGCRAAARKGPIRLEPLERRVDVVPGRTLVMPVGVDGPIDPRRPIRPVLDDGRSLDASLYWIAVAPDGTSPWLPPAGAWSATPASAHVRPAGAGAWCLVVPMPGDAIGQGLWLGSRRVPLNWLTDATLIVPPGEQSPWVPPHPDVPAHLVRLAEPDLRSPVRRWRHRLLTRGLGPARDEETGEELPAPDRFADHVLESLARQGEDRWRLALADLWRADPATADLLKRRLVLTLEFPGGVVAPAWPCDELTLDALLFELLNPRIAPAERAARARTWLDEQPAAVGWVIDDAGAVDAATGRPIATCAVANLSDRRTLAWAAALPLRASPDMTPLDALTARPLQVSPPPPDEEPGPIPSAAKIGLHVGRWSTTASAITEPLPARPPGFRIAPLFADWTLPRWLAGPDQAGATPADTEEWFGTALLMPTDAAPTDSPPTLLGRTSRWSLYVECRWVPAPPAGADQPEVIRVWLGPFGRASRVIRVTSAGEVTTEGAGRADAGGGQPVVSVFRHDDRWVALVPLPDECIEASGVLRLGVERTDARGRHAAWPRPMLPWQFEPGRAAIDLTAWEARAAGSR